MTVLFRMRTHTQCECGEWFAFVEDITDDDDPPPCFTTCPNCGKVENWSISEDDAADEGAGA